MGIRDWLIQRLAGSLPLPDQVGTGLRILGHQVYDADPLTNAKDQLLQYKGWTYAAANMIASDVSRMPWQILLKKGEDRAEWKPLENVQIPGIFFRPSADLTFAELIHLTQIHKDLTGKSYWNLVTNGVSSEVRGIQILNPDWYDSIRFSEGNTAIRVWKFNIPGRTPVDISDEDVIFHRYLDPVDRYTGASPVRAFALAQDVDIYTRGYMASFSRNRGTPEGILSSEQEINEEQAELARTRFKDAFQGKHETMILGKGAKFERIGANIKELDSGNVFRPQRDQILGVYNIPASRMGLQEDANRASGEEADRVYHQNCIGPRLSPLAMQINLRILERVGLDPSQHVFEFTQPDFSDQAIKQVKAEAAFNNSALTVNEYREQLGYEPLDEEHGSMYKISAGVKFVEDPSNAPEPAPVVEDPPDEEEDDDNEDKESLRFLGKIPLAARLEISKLSFITSQSSRERVMKGEIRRLLSIEQKAMIKELMEDGLAIRSDRELGANDQFDDEAWRELVARNNFGSYEKGWDLFADEFKAGLDFEIQNEIARDFAKSRAGVAVKDIKKTTLERLQKVVADGIAEGKSTAGIAKDVEGVYNGWKGTRAQTIARTEVSASLNAGKDAHAEKFNNDNPEVLMTKTWVPTQDDRTRETHQSSSIRALNNGSRTVRIEKQFRIGNSLMSRPHDPNGHVGEIVNCRCVLVYDG